MVACNAYDANRIMLRERLSIMKKILLSILLIPALAGAFGVYGSPGDTCGGVPLAGASAYAETYADSTESLPGIQKPHTSFFRQPKFAAFKYAGGSVLRTDKALKDTFKVPYAQYFEAKFGISSLGDTWQDVAFGMPYYGIGFGHYDFRKRPDMGHPLALYLFQGGTLANFSEKLRLGYEWNLGTSFNWKVYDPVTNPNNECIGSGMNVYIAANIYLSWMLSQKLDLNLGAAFNHVSNGATKMPNSGINTVAGFFELVYNFDRERIQKYYDPSLKPPHFEKRFVSDFSLGVTTRQRKLSPKRTGYQTKYVDHNFFVMGVNYAFMYQPSFRYRFGVALDGIYDESAGFDYYLKGYNDDGTERVGMRKGSDTEKRFSLGAGVHGEVVQSEYTIFAQIGYNVYSGDKDANRFYQAIGIKIPVWDGMYGMFSIRSRRFSKAQYLMFGVGYKLDHAPKEHRKWDKR